MTRYKVLRQIGCSSLTALFISFLNKLMNIPDGTIRFLHMDIDYRVNES
jgi:hypothetical protein